MVDDYLSHPKRPIKRRNTVNIFGPFYERKARSQKLMKKIMGTVHHAVQSTTLYRTEWWTSFGSYYSVVPLSAATPIGGWLYIKMRVT